MTTNRLSRADRPRKEEGVLTRLWIQNSFLDSDSILFLFIFCLLAGSDLDDFRCFVVFMSYRMFKKWLESAISEAKGAGGDLEIRWMKTKMRMLTVCFFSCYNFELVLFFSFCGAPWFLRRFSRIWHVTFSLNLRSLFAELRSLVWWFKTWIVWTFNPYLNQIPIWTIY